MRSDHATEAPARKAGVFALESAFARAAQAVSRQAGRSVTFILAFALILAWAVTGPVFHFSDTWQLVINTSTTIITFLMVFLIQHTQNLDTRAIQLKLDELIRATEGARNSLMALENRTEAELAEVKQEFADALTETLADEVGTAALELSAAGGAAPPETAPPPAPAAKAATAAPAPSDRAA